MENKEDNFDYAFIFFKDNVKFGKFGEDLSQSIYLLIKCTIICSYYKIAVNNLSVLFGLISFHFKSSIKKLFVNLKLNLNNDFDLTLSSLPFLRV